jgi:hypothetical protein
MLLAIARFSRTTRVAVAGDVSGARQYRLVAGAALVLAGWRCIRSAGR